MSHLGHQIPSERRSDVEKFARPPLVGRADNHELIVGNCLDFPAKPMPPWINRFATKNDLTSSMILQLKGWASPDSVKPLRQSNLSRSGYF